VENLVADGWDPARRWFPGLLLRSLTAPETAAVSTSRALLTLSAYCAAAIVITGAAVRRRDVAGA
jgi:hypothetical protein